jgi:hypothetical protein
MIGSPPTVTPLRRLCLPPELTPEISSTIFMQPGSENEIVSVEPVFGGDRSATRSPGPDFPALNARALESLVHLFSEQENLFSGSITLRGTTLHRERNSAKRTVIALLGLSRLAESKAAAPFDVCSMRDAVLRDTSWVKSLGELGLLAWFTAECEPDRLRNLFRQFDFDNALETYRQGREACTSGLAWFLAGISHARLVGPRTLPDLTDVAVDAYHLLLENQSDGGLFGQAAFPRWTQRARRRFGTFRDQIFAIYALALFARAFQIEEPLAPALSCANSIRSLQGDKGEWWFLYDKRACRVVNRYPVFSWHQAGAAPVGLLALAEATGQNFDQPIYKGLSSVSGSDQLGTDLESQQQGLIWDSVRPSGKAAKYWQAAFSWANISRVQNHQPLKVRYEARPDHFGWSLYAFGREGLPKK